MKPNTPSRRLRCRICEAPGDLSFGHTRAAASSVDEVDGWQGLYEPAPHGQAFAGRLHFDLDSVLIVIAMSTRDEVFKSSSKTRLKLLAIGVGASPASAKVSNVSLTAAISGMRVLIVIRYSALSTASELP